MIESFFGFTGTPFGRCLPVAELLKTEAWDELVGRLHYVAMRKSFAVVTGDSGTGKTTALRRFVSELDSNRYRVLYVCDSDLTPRNFYWETLYQLGYKPRFYRGDAKRQLQKALVELTQTRVSPVVVVDEAHLLSREMLEEIRFLLNTSMDSTSSVALILVGQTELKERLKLQIHQAIEGRVDVRVHLEVLNKEETALYVKQHLMAVKAAGDIFTTHAVNVMHEFSGGISRRVNKLATCCLMAAATRNLTLVDDHLVREVIESEFNL